LEFVAKAIYLLNLYSGSSMCPAAVWIISGLLSRRKNVTAPAPELLVFMAQAPAPASVRFHTLIF